MTDRQLQVRILWDGVENSIISLKKFEIDSHRYEGCDTAVLTFVRNNVAENGPALWFEQSILNSPWVSVEIRDLKENNATWTLIFYGLVDHVRVFSQNSVVEMECRDALARLIDLRMQDSWLNHTGADLLSVLAKASGLGARVSFPADMPDHMLGQFWQIEHKRGCFLSQHRFQTAADLAFSVAREALCDLYADGSNLVCEPIQSSYQNQDFIDVRGLVFDTDFARDLQLSSGIIVHLASWDSRQRNSTHLYYDGKTFSENAPVTEKTLHTFRVPGRRMEDLRRLARGKYERIAAHAVCARVSMPGLIGLGPRQFMRVVVGQTEEILGVDQVISRFSLEEGFVQHVVLRRRGGQT